MLWLLACTQPEVADDSVPISDLSPVLDEAFDYTAVCEGIWPEPCRDTPCALDDVASTYAKAWRDYVQPRWDLSDIEYSERVALWNASQVSPTSALRLAHWIPVGWHRVMLDQLAEPEQHPTAEEAAAYWENYDPAMDVPFREALVPYEDAIASAQVCADEVGMPLGVGSFCRTRATKMGDPERHLWGIATTGSNSDGYSAWAEVDLLTGELGTCNREYCCSD